MGRQSNSYIVKDFLHVGCALQLQITTLKPKLCAYNQDIIMAVSYDTKTKKTDHIVTKTNQTMQKR